jgi:hemoglobin/transferrin/lactoferrin receptor protein
MNGTNFSSAEWYYGPQKRLLAIYKLSKQKTFLNSDMNISVSYQNIEESRMNRNFGNPNLNSRIEKVAVFGLTADFKTKFNKTDFVYGIDFYYDNLSSIANKKNLLTGAESALSTRYPDGKNNSISTEGFVYLNNQFAEKMSYNVSFRAGYKLLKSEILTNYLNLPYTNIEQKNFTYSGAIGFVNNPSKHTKIALNLASAFRVPNIDDLGKIFDSKAGTLIVPNSDIKPEKTVTADLSITLWDGGNFMIENTIFITKLFDPILTDKFLLNGQSTTLYNPNGTTATVSQIYANQNQGKGTITGLSTTIKASFTKSLKGYGNVNICKGNTENQSGNFPLDHIAPVYGKIGLGFDNQKLTADLYMLYSGNKNIQSYSPSGEDNLQYAPIGGTKAWETYNFKIGVKIQKSINLFSGIENILDTQYRNFASGINAAGRNIYFGAKYGF